MNRWTAADLLAQAAAQTGLSDFGDASYADGLEQTLEGIRAASLMAEVREAAVERLRHNLRNRLRIEEWYTAHPSTESDEIKRPVFVFGLPRSGTSATVGLMSLDPQFRYFRRWEGRDPVPPPPPIGEDDDDPRLIAAIARVEHRLMSDIHLSEPNGPEEEMSTIGAMNFRGYEGALPMPDSFIDWWLGDDFQSTYAYHRRVLKLLQARQPSKTWLLKSNPHLFNLDALLTHYPDARFVMTHRDPCKTIPSLASMNWRLHGLAQGERADKRWAGKRALRFWAEGMQRCLAARDRIGEHRFVDIHNAALLADPIGSIERVYDRFDLGFTEQTQKVMLKFQADNQPDKGGRHRYTPEEYGLSASEIRSSFADYIDRFGVCSTAPQTGRKTTSSPEVMGPGTEWLSASGAETARKRLGSTLATREQAKGERRVLRVIASPQVKAARAGARALMAAHPIAALPDAAARIDADLDAWTVQLALQEVDVDPTKPWILWSTADTPYDWFGHHFPVAAAAIDNPDNIYRHVALDGSQRYALNGQLGPMHAAQFLFQLTPHPEGTGFASNSNTGTGDRMASFSTLTSSAISIDADGAFSITLDSRPAEGRANHIMLPPGRLYLTIRDTLSDWKQSPLALRIEHKGGPRLPPPPDETAIAASTARHLSGYVAFWLDFIDHFQSSPPENKLMPPWGRTGGWGFASTCRFRLRNDQAMIITARSANALYRGIQLTDPWMISPPFTF